MAKNPNWTRNEVVLAADAMRREGAAYGSPEWRPPGLSSPRTLELTQLLRFADFHPDLAHDDSSRSIGSVHAKFMNIDGAIKEFRGGINTTHGGRFEPVVVEEFYGRNGALAVEADKIRREIAGKRAPGAPRGHLPRVDRFPEPASPIEVQGLEGGKISYPGTRIERDPKLRQAKIASVLNSGNSLDCEVCQFNFAQFYGARGDNYAHIHHVVPLYISGETVTTLDDLAVVCANCHAMIHRKPLTTPTQLRLTLTSPVL